VNQVPAWLAGVKAGRVHLCRAADNTVVWQVTLCSSEMGSHRAITCNLQQQQHGCLYLVPTQIAKIREDVDYYISSCRESDFEENEELYDDLELEAASAALGSRLAAMNHDNDGDHSSDVSSEAASLQNSAGSVSPSPSLAHSKVTTTLAVVVLLLLLLLLRRVPKK